MEFVKDLVSIVIPCYGSEKTLKGVIDELVSLFAQQSRFDYEIIAVNDASPDKVYDVIQECAKQNPKVKGIDLAINRGKHCAILVGYAHVSGEFVVNLDDDGQCPADRIWDLLKPLDEGYDMAMAKYAQKKESFMKKFGSSVNDRISRSLLNKPKGMRFTNFIARKRFVTDAMKNYKMPYAYLEGLSLCTTRNVKMVDMEERSRAAGRSGYTFAKSFKLWMNGYTSFSAKPLRVSTFAGLFLVLAGVGIMILDLIFCLAKYSTDLQFLLLLGVIFFLFGIVLLALGMLGEYVGRIFVAQNTANQYIIRDKCNLEDDSHC
ncbi:MAG: glycosyltransferase [Clostridiales bacterium]|nr:glycosyltransferase [Clostridiales bacterium]